MNLPELWSSTSLADPAVLPHRPGDLRLDKAFVLIEGHPAIQEKLEGKVVEWMEPVSEAQYGGGA